ncbi:shikimate dehydrogenase (plasmid) [Qingshengfaniella alkalisoli]|uniref:Shikimate dehydrogenase n=2 Tax=Qingshengfaniella alkalisoli TaxID=2599296 RepID=A0A5B8J9N9_9RHOB|nr:shikimate dehydrogenase [Qingshengfaniella alkalisoli]
MGLVGRGISQSRTPAMHMAEAAAQGVCGVYKLLDMDAPERCDLSLAQMLRMAEATGFSGLNVTYPYKIEIIPLLDELSANAKAVGAVNTVVLKDGKRVGHNTDLWGFAESFKRGLDGAAVRDVLLLGAGGAGVAVAHALADCGVVRLSVFDIDPDRAARLCDQLGANRPQMVLNPVTDIEALVAKHRPDGVVNATPMGMAKLPGSAFPTGLLDARMWVADIVYFPLETELLRAAREVGCRVLPGSGMAVFQAVRAFELFTGRAAKPGRMKATFDSFDVEAKAFT